MKWNDIYWIFKTLPNQKLKNWEFKIIYIFVFILNPFLTSVITFLNPFLSPLLPFLTPLLPFLTPLLPFLTPFLT